VFQEVKNVHQGKDSSSHRCSLRHWSGMRQGAPEEWGTGQLHWVITLACKGSVTTISRLTNRHGFYGGCEGRIVRPPRVTESKGRHNKN